HGPDCSPMLGKNADHLRLPNLQLAGWNALRLVLGVSEIDRAPPGQVASEPVRHRIVAVVIEELPDSFGNRLRVVPRRQHRALAQVALLASFPLPSMLHRAALKHVGLAKQAIALLADIRLLGSSVPELVVQLVPLRMLLRRDRSVA